MRNEVGGRVVESNTKCANKTGSRGTCSVVGDSSLHSVEFYFVVCRRSVGRLFALIKSGYNLIQHWYENEYLSKKGLCLISVFLCDILLGKLVSIYDVDVIM